MSLLGATLTEARARHAVLPALLWCLASLGVAAGEQKGPCAGGDVAACRCLLGCGIFPASPSQCESGGLKEMHALVNKLVTDELHQQGAETQCAGMKCVIDCAHRLGCLTYPIKSKCVKLVWDLSACDLNCAASGKAAEQMGAALFSSGMLTALSVLALVAPSL
mmetsp:Transcript_81780/g.189970  ORF Transcript_81780/g.189970 Transcript_81780/m.189970 type:complete len:164 (+) Transcript_81780:137-628(+)